MAQWKQIRLGTMRFQFRSLASLSGLRIWHWGVRGCMSAAPILPLAWEPPYAMGGPLKSQKKKKKKRKCVHLTQCSR